MNYVFRGRLCGLICPECPEPLSNVKVRLYRIRSEQNVTALAVAAPKDTFAILTDEQVRAKQSALLGEFDSDEAGNFTAVLGEKQQYGGEAFEVDVYCGTVPRLKPGPRPPQPIQFSITVVQPMWRQGETEVQATWDYCLSQRYWCQVRARQGAWTICGRVTTCAEGTPVFGVTVSAFDVDWWQDDPLGSAVTDSDGKFRINYLASDFRKTPFSPLINVEWFGGPDVYFKIELGGGDVLLNEPPSRGRAPDRENIGPCFCVDLCVEEPPVVKHAWFTHVGDFDINSDINWATDGKTSVAAPTSGIGAHGGPGFGFYDGWYGFGLKLIGDCPTTHPGGGDPMRYRFLTAAAGAPPSALTPITAGQVTSIQVGTRPIMWDVFGTGPISTFQSIIVAPAGATAPGPTPPPSPLPPPGTPWGPIPPVILVPDADGWVVVDPNATNGGFSGPLLRFVSSTVVPGGAAPGSGAGNAPASPKNGSTQQIVFQAEPVTGPSIPSPTLTNSLNKIFINNWSAVNELDIQQFLMGGAGCCSALTSDLDILYTADHELMRSWGLSILSCAVNFGWTAPILPSGTAPRGGSGTAHQDISGWPGCSYAVYLSTTRALTDGEVDDPGTTSEKTFCIDR